MLSAFVSNITKKQLFNGTDHFLVAVSGGIDSMVLCDLLLKANYKFAVAHCNFKLRAEESDKDEQFVKEFCSRNQLEFYYKRFDTEKYCKEKKISIQMAARELRYEFFKDVMKANTFDHLLTAHHLSDNVESFLINLIRGSGVSGLKGISEKQDKLIRPLLQFTKEEIELYAKENSIDHRTDQSNFEDHYLRNNIRLNIIPHFKALNHSFEHTVAKELRLLSQYNTVITEHFKKEKEEAIKIKDRQVHISIAKVKQNNTPELLLFEILKEYGFHADVIANIYESLSGISGKLFYSERFELVKDREELIINERKHDTIVATVIEKETNEIALPIHLKLSASQTFEKSDRKNVAFIDLSKIKYPLTVRGWQTGDKFKPLGMNGYKKLSDLFVDLKLNAFEKNKVAVLENGNKEIIWVVNHRLDDRYKISENTNSILKIELIE